MTSSMAFPAADKLYSLAEIDTALNDLAAKLQVDYATTAPVLLCVMNGAVMTAGQLIPKLNFPLQLDYIHATRYGDALTGGALNWLHKPSTDLAGRDVLLVEDIYDRGDTLAALRAYCHAAGAKTVRCVVLVNKLHDNKVGTTPEYIGITIPDRYVFGFGMDYQGWWRNADGIYAVKKAIK